MHGAQVRGKGLLNAVVIKEEGGVSAHEICMALMDRGVLAKPTHGNIVRLAPPLVITEEQILECADIFRDAVLSFDR
jgi:ornithine--oxo-acid transaminase